MAFSLESTAHALEQRIQANRLLDLPVPWADELIFPAYDGLSIYNVPHTVAHLLDGPNLGGPPLDEAVWGGADLSDIRRVVVILSDGLGYRWLNEYMADDEELRAVVSDLTAGQGPLPLTSTCPSTTATAMTTLWTGAPPAGHGMLSFRLYLREISTLAIPLFWMPVAGNLPKGSLSQFGLEPEDFVPVPGLADQLAAADIPTHLSLRYDFMNTGLSRILHRGLTPEGQHVHLNSTDLWQRLREMLVETAGQHCYLSVYWDTVDTLSHAYGSGNAYIHASIKRQLTDLRDVLADAAVHDGQTLLLFLADHGHYNMPQVLNLKSDSRAAPLAQALRGALGGEGRLPYLYLRDGHKQNVIDCVESEFADWLTWLDPAEALAAGLFGPGEPYAEAEHRLGDLILVPRLNWKIDDNSMPPGAYPMISGHGGLADWEMLVPLLWQRL